MVKSRDALIGQMEKNKKWEGLLALAVDVSRVVFPDGVD